MTGRLLLSGVLGPAFGAVVAAAAMRGMLQWRGHARARWRLGALSSELPAGDGWWPFGGGDGLVSDHLAPGRSAARWLGSLVLVRASPELRDRWARRVGAGLIAGLVVAVLQPALAPFAALIGASTPILSDRRAGRARALRIQQALPDAIDLLALAVGAGCNPVLAIRHVATKGEGEVVDALRSALKAHDAGQRLADALDSLPQRLGQPGRPFEGVRPLVAILTAAERYGAPLLEPLSRLAVDARVTRRQLAETAARRLPIKLLFPLIICILPAFGLLTVAPLLASGLKSLRL